MGYFAPTDRGKVREDLEFQYLTDIEKDKDTLWRVDRVDAYLERVRAGYLRISYIPVQMMNSHCPGVLNYLSRIKGHQVLPREKRAWSWETIPIAEFRECVYSMALVAGFSWERSCALGKEAKLAKENDLRATVQLLEHNIRKRHEAQFEQFKAFHVDRPLVDFIEVKEGLRRQGIGTALYRAAYWWTHQRGLPFYASDCQSKEAETAWKSMAKRFDVIDEATPDLISPEKTLFRLRFA